jgi:hypothetical protein
MDTFLRETVGATKALVHFCKKYDVRDPGWNDVFDCLDAFEQGKTDQAISAYKQVPLGANGFSDWQPSSNVTPDEEEAVYLIHVFRALVMRWYQIMDHFIEKHTDSKC